MLRTATYNKKNLSENLVNSVHSGLNCSKFKIMHVLCHWRRSGLIVQITLDRSRFQVRALARDILYCVLRQDSVPSLCLFPYKWISAN